MKSGNSGHETKETHAENKTLSPIGQPIRACGSCTFCIIYKNPMYGACTQMQAMPRNVFSVTKEIRLASVDFSFRPLFFLPPERNTSYSTLGHPASNDTTLELKFRAWRTSCMAIPLTVPLLRHVDLLLRSQVLHILVSFRFFLLLFFCFFTNMVHTYLQVYTNTVFTSRLVGKCN